MSLLKRIAKCAYSAIPFKQPIFTLVRSISTVPEPIYRHLHFKGTITVPVGAKASFRMGHHGYMIENELFWQGLDGWEKISFELWKRLSQRSSVIFDIGANTGVFALLAQAVRPEATVLAAEPVARIFAKLQGNIALNGGRIIGVQAAITDHKGTAILYDMPESEHVLSVSLDPEWNKESKHLRPVKVPCLTVMDLLELAGSSTVDLLKIDVETHEPAVLKGFAELLRRDRPTMLIELLTDEVAEQVSRTIHGLDYVYYNIDDVTWPPPRVQALSRSGHFNFLICRPEVAAAIGL